ncbi:hypothetical protein PT2222_400027 [Paraburkholderia tropica]
MKGNARAIVGRLGNVRHDRFGRACGEKGEGGSEWDSRECSERHRKGGGVVGMFNLLIGRICFRFSEWGGTERAMRVPLREVRAVGQRAIVFEREAFELMRKRFTSQKTTIPVVCECDLYKRQAAIQRE